MVDKSAFLLNLSVLYRNTQKYFDKVLVPYEIGSGQLIFLLCINENEGLTMQELTNMTEVDKGTTTKSVQRLIDQGYVRSVQDETDRRVKRLYTTAKASAIMNTIYDCRTEMRTALAKNMDSRTFENMLGQAADNARNSLVPSQGDISPLKIGGLMRMSLLDYPGEVACTVFMSGCNLKCPFCHNRDLVFIPENYEFIEPEEILSFLEKRKSLLDAVCISGGEALLQKNLISLVRRIRELGYLIKLDTNGCYPERLQEIVESGLIDYVAMDVKNTPEKYAATVGMNKESFDIEPIRRSMEYLKSGVIPFEFRTTVVREFHSPEDLEEIAGWIGHCEHYYLQKFEDSGNMIQSGFTAYEDEEMKEMLQRVRRYVPTAELRGI